MLSIIGNTVIISHISYGFRKDGINKVFKGFVSLLPFMTRTVMNEVHHSSSHHFFEPLIGSLFGSES